MLYKAILKSVSNGYIWGRKVFHDFTLIIL